MVIIGFSLCCHYKLSYKSARSLFWNLTLVCSDLHLKNIPQMDKARRILRDFQITGRWRGGVGGFVVFTNQLINRTSLQVCCTLKDFLSNSLRNVYRIITWNNVTSFVFLAVCVWTLFEHYGIIEIQDWHNTSSSQTPAVKSNKLLHSYYWHLHRPVWL